MAKAEINYTPPVEPKIESVTLTLSYEEAKELTAVLYSGVPGDILPEVREALIRTMGHWKYRRPLIMSFGGLCDSIARNKNKEIIGG